PPLAVDPGGPGDRGRGRAAACGPALGRARGCARRAGHRLLYAGARRAARGVARAPAAGVLLARRAGRLGAVGARPLRGALVPLPLDAAPRPRPDPGRGGDLSGLVAARAAPLPSRVRAGGGRSGPAGGPARRATRRRPFSVAEHVAIVD